MVRYRRTKSNDSFNILHTYAESLMILLFHYKKILFHINNLDYDCSRKGWSSSSFLELSKFLVAASIGLNIGVSPKDYIAAAIEYRRSVLFKRMVLDQNYLCSDLMLKALEIYLWNRTNYGGSYEPLCIPELTEIELKYIYGKLNGPILWKTLSQDNGIDNALKLILTTDLYLYFERTYLESLPEFKERRKIGRIVWDKKRYVWI